MIANDTQLIQQIKQTLLEGRELQKLNMRMRELPSRVGAFYAFVQKYLIPLYSRLIQDTDNRLRVTSLLSTTNGSKHNHTDDIIDGDGELPLSERQNEAVPSPLEEDTKTHPDSQLKGLPGGNHQAKNPL